MRAAWGAAATVPAGCERCAEDWAAYFPFIAGKYPRGRLSFVGYTDDRVIRGGFSGPIAEPADYRRALDEYTRALSQLPNTRVFLVEGQNHVLAKESLSKTRTGTMTFGAFLSELVDRP
jgi:hypothetical protein